MFLTKVQPIHSMVLRWHLALSLFSCVLVLVSYLNRKGIRFVVVFFNRKSDNIFSLFRSCILSICVIYLACFDCIFCFLFFVWLLNIVSGYYLPFPDSRLYSNVHISVHTARLSTIGIYGKYRTLWSNSTCTSNDFNFSTIFIWYYLFHHYVYVLIKLLFVSFLLLLL
jgi:hypothetical protein